MRSISGGVLTLLVTIFPVMMSSGCQSRHEPPASVQTTSAPASPSPTNEQIEPPEPMPADMLYGDEPLVPPLVLGDDEQPAETSPALTPIGLTAKTNGPNVPLIGGVLTPDFSADPIAHFHPHGSEVCASGCAASNHPTPELQRAQLTKLLQACAEGPFDETNHALESLLYYGRQTAAMLGDAPARSLDSEQERLLRRELSRTHALVRFRVVDEQGAIRVTMPPTRVPLDRRHVYDMTCKDLPPLVISGTVKRVGLHHLWTRL